MNPEPSTNAATPQAIRRPSSPSFPPSGMTWPMVAYALVRELPYTVMIVAGCIVAVMFLYRAPSSTLEPLAAIIVPAVVSALGRSKPAETVQLGVVALLWAKLKGWTS